MERSQPRTSVALIGAGIVGTAVALLLQKAGYTIVAVGWSGRASSGRAGQLLGAPVCAPGSMPKTDVLLLGVPDHSIGRTASDAVSQLSSETLVVHFAGALGAGVLDAVRASGGHPCALHPVQSCPDIDSAVRWLPGSAWGVTCAPEIEVRANELVSAAAGRPVRVAEEHRPLWHAAAATVANGTTALLAAGESMLAAIGIESPPDVLGPLATGTVANAAGPGNAAGRITGPVARGDLATIRRHLDALEADAPDLVDRYRHAALLVLATARDGNKLDARAGEEVLDLIRDG